MEKSQAQFSSIQNYLKNALFLKQQLKFEEGRKKQLQVIGKASFIALAHGSQNFMCVVGENCYVREDLILAPGRGFSQLPIY